jgi:hypothetical protein
MPLPAFLLDDFRLTLLTLWPAVASHFVNFAPFVNLVRIRICQQISLMEKEISHKVHKGHKFPHKDRHGNLFRRYAQYSQRVWRKPVGELLRWNREFLLNRRDLGWFVQAVLSLQVRVGKDESLS